MREKTYDDLRRFIGFYIDLHPDTEGTLTEYAQWFAKRLYQQRMDSPASHVMVELAAYIDRSKPQPTNLTGNE